MEFFIGGILRVQDPTVEFTARQPIDDALTRRKVPPSKHNRAFGLRVHRTHARQKADAIICPLLAGENQHERIIRGPQLPKLLKGQARIRPRRNGIVSAIPPLELATNDHEVLGLATHQADEPSLHY
jgi:hypothetical protein